MNLIGLNGFKQSGKDTTYGILKTGLPNDTVVRRAFADKLKVMAAKALGFERSDEELIALMDSFKESADFSVYYGDPETGQPTQHDLSGRQYLQWFGGHARDVFWDSFWIDHVLPSGQALEAELGTDFDDYQVNEVVAERFDYADWGVITDCRYPNEAQRVLDLGGEVWEIVRPGLTSDGHSSEQPLDRDLVTVSISNDSTIQRLSEKVMYEALHYGKRKGRVIV